MPRYVAFLRAVNVGGRIVKMDVLREAFESLGFAPRRDVHRQRQRHLRNAVHEPCRAQKRIEGCLLETLGYRVDTIIRSEAEVRDIAAYDPFRGRTLEGAATYISLLAARPGAAARRAIDALQTEEELFHTHERELYWHRKPSMRMATFSGAVLEKTIGGRCDHAQHQHVEAPRGEVRRARADARDLARAGRAARSAQSLTRSLTGRGVRRTRGH